MKQTFSDTNFEYEELFGDWDEIAGRWCRLPPWLRQGLTLAEAEMLRREAMGEVFEQFGEE